jgi:hypothetical protein
MRGFLADAQSKASVWMMPTFVGRGTRNDRMLKVEGWIVKLFAQIFNIAACRAPQGDHRSMMFIVAVLDRLLTRQDIRP